MGLKRANMTTVDTSLVQRLARHLCSPSDDSLDYSLIDSVEGAEYLHAPSGMLAAIRARDRRIAQLEEALEQLSGAGPGDSPFTVLNAGLPCTGGDNMHLERVAESLSLKPHS